MSSSSTHDFWADLDFVVKDRLENFGVKYSKKKSTEDLLVDFLTVLRKLVKPKPRSVLVSPILQKKLESHPKRKEIQHIISLLKKGENTNFFQSEKLLQSGSHDNLQYEWKIHHFHLSLEKQTDSNFYKRTKALLFVYVTDEKAILLDVRTHSREEKSIFADEYWMQILHDHFFDEVEQFRNSIDMPASGKNYSADERLQLWNKGYSPFMLEISGNIYHSPGIGRASSGHSILVIQEYNTVIRWIHYANEILTSHRETILNKLSLASPKLHLAITEYGLSIVDHASRGILLYYPQRFTFDE